MDALDQLTERAQCGRCGRLVRYSDDFCTDCRQARPSPIVVTELAAAAR